MDQECRSKIFQIEVGISVPSVEQIARQIAEKLLEDNGENGRSEMIFHVQRKIDEIIKTEVTALVGAVMENRVTPIVNTIMAAIANTATSYKAKGQDDGQGGRVEDQARSEGLGTGAKGGKRGKGRKAVKASGSAKSQGRGTSAKGGTKEAGTGRKRGAVRSRSQRGQDRWSK